MLKLQKICTILTLRGRKHFCVDHRAHNQRDISSLKENSHLFADFLKVQAGWMLTFQPDRKQNTTREQKVLVFLRYYHYLYPLLLFMNAFQPIETSFVKTTENGWNLTPKGSPRSPRRRELSPHKSSLSPKSAHGSPKCKLNAD